MKQVVIYKITSPTNRIYIGQTRNWYSRFHNYKGLWTKGQPKIHHSLMKYGWSAHKFEIVHELPPDVSQEVLNNYEILYWQQYKDCGFNMLNTKEPGSNGRVAIETKTKISKALKGRKVPQSTIDKRINTYKTLPRTEKQQNQILLASKKGDNHPKARKVIDTVTGEIWGNVKAAAKANTVNSSTLGYYLKGTYTNKTTLKYL